ncbi:hypothetical protein NSQ91_29515 [Paenibacillus sp. FSL R7-0048]|jgi:hypothetical protein|uniref:Bacteriocin n=1 Tax=Paenibacillus odorifer TaxID=189426 RepID=A0ABX3GJQ8_9BACL|nr:hypothetical protein [Paenibacillus odorifer]HBS45734.1 hypothetical protein [Paenibacillus sp.]OMC64263.1 hypothetical protein BK121_25685 [Paenibacillus odorifer]OMC77622.1 hypothetical protein BK125_13935 [Paenibacillus odorifer]OMD19382.1 hypothetical protein BSO21_25690 [Paenibacillus odorifer]OMD68475.1 hypothetical protein BSK62_02935 [Paenibacillus odorifer]
MLSYAPSFSELTLEDSINIDGGVDWAKVGAGVLGMVTIMSAVAAAPVTATAAVVYISGTVAAGYLVGTSF